MTRWPVPLIQHRPPGRFKHRCRLAWEILKDGLALLAAIGGAVGLLFLAYIVLQMIGVVSE